MSPTTTLATSSEYPSSHQLGDHKMSILLLSFCLIVLSLCFTVYNRAYHPLHSFPGPFWAAQTDLWRVYHICTKQMPGTLEALHATHGPVVRIGPNDLSFQSAQAIGPIYKSGRRVIKSSFYDGFTAFHPNLFGAQDEDVSRVPFITPSEMVI